MKLKAFIRVARGANGKAKIEATVRPSAKPLTDSNGHELPTIGFAVTFDVPDAMFKRAEQVVAEIVVDPKFAQIAADVRQVPA